MEVISPAEALAMHSSLAADITAESYIVAKSDRHLSPSESEPFKHYANLFIFPPHLSLI